VFVWSSSGVSSLKECPQIYSNISCGSIYGSLFLFFFQIPQIQRVLPIVIYAPGRVNPVVSINFERTARGKRYTVCVKSFWLG
jgi:hypothetical protein